MLKELADVTARPLSIILNGSRRVGEGPKDGRDANVSALPEWQEGGPGEAEASQITSIPWEVREQFIWESISRHLEDKPIIRSSQQEFSKGRPCMAKTTTLYDETTVLVDKGRACILPACTSGRPLTVSPLRSS